MSIRVAHVKKEAGTYVGRPSRGRRGSPLANPYKMRSEADREGVISAYNTWLTTCLFVHDPDITRAIDALVEEHRRLGSLVLTCWCSPKPCHADVIARVVQERLDR